MKSFIAVFDVKREKEIKITISVIVKKELNS